MLHLITWGTWVLPSFKTKRWPELEEDPPPISGWKPAVTSLTSFFLLVFRESEHFNLMMNFFPPSPHLRHEGSWVRVRCKRKKSCSGGEFALCKSHLRRWGRDFEEFRGGASLKMWDGCFWSQPDKLQLIKQQGCGGVSMHGSRAAVHDSAWMQPAGIPSSLTPSPAKSPDCHLNSSCSTAELWLEKVFSTNSSILGCNRSLN